MKPRLCFILSAALLVPPVVQAQLDFGKLTKALDTGSKLAKTAKGVVGIGLPEEKIIGESVALEVIGQFGGLVRDEDITRRVNLVGLALARYCDRPELEWRFGVLNSSTVNAFSAPGGYVFITRGLYDLAGTDDLLAGILGHEISHITGRHALKIIENGELLGGAKALIAERSGQFRDAEARVNQVDAQLQQFGPSIKATIKTIIVDGYNAPTEYAADKGGHDLARITGYAPGGLRAVLQDLQAKKGDPKKIFSTHPPLKERIKRLPDEPAAVPASPAS